MKIHLLSLDFRPLKKNAFGLLVVTTCDYFLNLVTPWSGPFFGLDGNQLTP